PDADLLALERTVESLGVGLMADFPQIAGSWSVGGGAVAQARSAGIGTNWSAGAADGIAPPAGPPADSGAVAASPAWRLSWIGRSAVDYALPRFRTVAQARSAGIGTNWSAGAADGIAPPAAPPADSCTVAASPAWRLSWIGRS